jgi:hypothetical protein
MVAAKPTLVLAQTQKKAVAAPEKKADAENADQLKQDGKADEKARKEPAKFTEEEEKALRLERERKDAAKQEAAEKKDVVDEVDAGLVEFEQQYKQQFQQLVRGELVFIRTVCKPTKEQYQRIAAVGDQALKDTVRKFAEVQKKMMRGGFQAGQQPTFPDPRKLITESLAKSVTETLSAEQVKQYQAELEKRAANRKRVALINLVAKFDHDLVLTAEQRVKLTESLSSQWNDAWSQSLEMFQHGDQFYPNVSDNLVLPILSESQRGVWRSAPKNNNVFWGWAGLGFMGGVQVVDDDWDAKPAEAAKPDEATKPDEKPEEMK